MKRSKSLLGSLAFKLRNKLNEKSFTRDRKLPFAITLTLILQKSMKSAQLLLNEMFMELNMEVTTSNSAFTQARAKLKHTAFIELNQVAVVDVMYDTDDYKRYKGMRVLAVDGSKVRLPETKEVTKEFGQISYNVNGVKGKHTYALASVLYDVLNNVAIDSILAPAKAYEVDLAINHLQKSTEDDLILYDRNYPSFRHIATLITNIIQTKNKNWVIRCSNASFKEVRKMLNGEGDDSQIVTINVHHSKLKEIRELNLPEYITVRLVRVLLPTGEYEVLVTSLLDEEKYPTNEFLFIYNMRWGIECFYGVLKNRLLLENFSGETVESIYQDFYSTVYLSGMETILTQDVNDTLSKKHTQNRQQVNHAVSFNAIKNKAFALLFSEDDYSVVLNQLEMLFKMNPVQIRDDRTVPRVNSSDTKKLNYHKRKRKICY